MLTDRKICEDDIRALYELLVSVSSVEDCRALFEDLCTIKEVEQMSQRVKAAKLLLEGKTYTQVMEQTEISSATLSRVSRCVQYGSGYTRFLNK
ncbi:MAG: TrpR-related protein YerC/YecD [Clostridia bacterium]|nr:TrpR-related protein YerC/YecD [Clostridia bacterium]